MTAILSVTELRRTYPGHGMVAEVQAVRGVDFELASGASLGIVGESGCGKSTLGRMLVGLETPTSGEILVTGVSIKDLRHRHELARTIQLVFQDPFSSLNPRLSAGSAINEVLKANAIVTDPNARQARVIELLGMVSLGSQYVDRLPAEMSGGQAQRVAIARALALEPKILILDEPTSALDVSVRAEVVNLLLDLRAELGLSYVFISHDMAIIRHVSDRIAVMNDGVFVETGPAHEIFTDPQDPYTRLLLEAVPSADPDAAFLGITPS